nr:hypothetical protein CFP56_41489 [Quercus suber]
MAASKATVKLREIFPKSGGSAGAPDVQATAGPVIRNQETTFLSLPQELRDCIYRSLFDRESIYGQRHSPGCLFKGKRTKEIPLFRTGQHVPYGRSDVLLISELRDRNELALTRHTNIRLCRELCRRRQCTNICLVNKQIRVEACALFWKEQTLNIEAWLEDFAGLGLLSGPASALGLRIKYLVRSLRFVEHLHYPSAPLVERSRCLLTLSSFTELRRLEIPATFASQKGLVALRYNPGLRNLAQVYITAIARILIRTTCVPGAALKRSRHRVTLYLHFQHVVPMPSCWVQGHRPWLDELASLNLVRPYNVNNCPTCHVELLKQQHEVERWYDWEAHTDPQVRVDTDVVGRAVREVKRQLTGRVPYMQDWTDSILGRWREGNWCLMKAGGGSHYKGEQPIECRVIGLPDRPSDEKKGEEAVTKVGDCGREI